MNHIGPRPAEGMYSADLEVDCQCARCGSSCEWVRCEDIDCNDGYITDWDDDGFDDLSRTYTCDICDGYGGWHRCLSSKEWCEANPVPGREEIKRGQIEWFTIPVENK